MLNKMKPNYFFVISLCQLIYFANSAPKFEDVTDPIQQHLTKIEKIVQVESNKKETLIKEAKQLALDTGLICLGKQLIFNGVGLTPFTLFPSPFPRKNFQQASNIQTAFNLLYFRIMRDYQFLSDVYQKMINYDETFQNAMQILDQVHSEGIKQPLTILFQRADYMLCIDKNEENMGSKYTLKQVEVNGAAIGGLDFSAKTSLVHRQIVSRLGLNLSNTEDVNTNKNVVEVIYQAWLKFDNPDAIIVMIVKDDPYHYYERRFLFLELYQKFVRKVIKLTLAECGSFLSLDSNDFTLRYGNQIVAVVFNQQTMLSFKPIEMRARLIIERSTAIKAPSLAAALAHTKAVQEVLSRPGMVERFFPHPDEAPLIGAIRTTFAKFWTIEEDNNDKYNNLIKNIKQSTEKYVLKKCDYAFMENRSLSRIYFGQEMVNAMAKFTPAERSAYILMEKLEPVVMKNHLVLSSEEKDQQEPFLKEVTPELGMFGALLGNVVDGEVLYNAQIGHMIKTKLANENEGGLCQWHSVIDTAYFVD